MHKFVEIIFRPYHFVKLFAKQFYKMIWSENYFNKFMIRLTTAEEYSIDFPELPHYIRLLIENGITICIYICKSIFPPPTNLL